MSGFEDNRLLVYNGDLTGRVVSIDADKWDGPELMEVITRGAELLGIRFNAQFSTDLISKSQGSVYIVQEACRRACIFADVLQTAQTCVEVGVAMNAEEMIKEVVNEQSARYMKFITQFAAGFQDTQLQMFKWLIYPILAASEVELEAGFSYRHLKEAIRGKHPIGESLNAGNLTQALQSVASLQVGKGITPIIIDYDQTGLRLEIVDRGFTSWLSYQDKNDILSSLDLPLLDGGRNP